MAKPVYATAVVERVITEPRAAVWGTLVVETDDQHTGETRWRAAGHDFVVETIALEPPWRLVHRLHDSTGAELIEITAVLVEHGDDTVAMWSVLVGPDDDGDRALAAELRDALATRLDRIAEMTAARPRIGGGAPT